MKYFVAFVIFAIILLFSACENNKPTNNSAQSEINNQVYIEKGKKIASSTFVTLSSNLKKAMKEGGVSNAVKYCNLSAYPLVDSLQNKYDAKIRRTSLKVRNPKNKPTKMELEQLQTYEKQIQKGEKIKPIIKEITGNQIAFFAPIHMMPLCQKCHGLVGETLIKKDYEVIQDLYPEDNAIGYVSGDWRGMWSISFQK